VGTARVACDELDDDEAKRLAELIVHPWWNYERCTNYAPTIGLEMSPSAQSAPTAGTKSHYLRDPMLMETD
jgi:hypothetical protein